LFTKGGPYQINLISFFDNTIHLLDKGGYDRN